MIRSKKTHEDDAARNGTPDTNQEPNESSRTNQPAEDFDPTTFGGDRAPADDPAPDPFDVESMRIDGDQGDAVEVDEVVTVVPVRKPGKEAYVRVHSDETYRGMFRVLNFKETREMWLVDRKLWPSLLVEPIFVPLLLVTAVTLSGDVFIWPLRVPGPDGRLDDWGRSEKAAAEQARTAWVRVMAKQGGVGYACQKASSDQLPEPRWPPLSFKQLLTIAFTGKYIGDANHAKLRQLRGEA